MITLSVLTRALRRVHLELAAVGILDDLEAIDVELSLWPSGWIGELGFVYDRGVGGLAALAGFREGVVYIPWNAPFSRRRGLTFRDVLRHEYAHALAWARPSFVRGRWFRETFGAAYDEAWASRPAFDPDAFASEYATTSPKEDFAESFAVWLRSVTARRPERLGAGVRRKVEAVAARARERSSR